MDVKVRRGWGGGGDGEGDREDIVGKMIDERRGCGGTGRF